MSMVSYKNLIEKEKENFWNVADIYKTKDIKELQDICKKEAKSFDICLLNVTGDLNIGTMIRSASLFGARKVTIFGRREYDRRSTVGSDKYIDVNQIAGLLEDGKTINTQQFITTIQDNNWFPIFIEQGGESLETIQWNNINFANLIPCFIFGNEGDGISTDILSINTKNKKIISIPQKGVIRSFNVSSAMNIVIWDYIKTTL